MQKEKDFQIEFTKWAKNCFSGTAAFELKFTKTDSIPFSSLAEHQRNALLAARTGEGATFKIPDAGYQNPFDCFKISRSLAFVVLMYYAPRKRDFVMVPIEKWCEEETTSKRKSLTEARAKEIGKVYTLRGDALKTGTSLG